jgi:glucose/arabinose dehydrogenase
MKSCIGILTLAAVVFTSAVGAQQSGRRALPDGPQVFTGDWPGGDAQPYRVVPIKGLFRPWALAFLPNGDILVTEWKTGHLRIIRGGVLDPQPISGMPQVNTGAVNSGLMDIALHPRFAENHLVYFTYSKGMPGNPHEDLIGKKDAAAATLARGRFDGGTSITEVRDVFVSDAWSQGTSGSRFVFGRDGKIYMTVGIPTRHKIGKADDAQNPANHAGKILRLNDDGTVPPDNPFVRRTGYRPEIYALGIRNALGLFVHPDTGQIWETENGPMGGDEINILKPGANYGWPVVSYGRDYSGEVTYNPKSGPTGPGYLSGPTSQQRLAEGMEEPFMYWNPSPALSGITIYTGDKFPAWKGNLFVGALGHGNLGSQSLHRIVLSQRGLPQTQSDFVMLYELKQRIRDVKQGPDGYLYMTTDEEAGAVLRIEPAVERSPQ